MTDRFASRPTTMPTDPLRSVARRVGLQRQLATARRRRLLKRVATFRDITVVPYAEVLTEWLGGHCHDGGPIWPQWDSQRGARFNRNRQPRDRRPDDREPEARVAAGDYFWIGPLHPHFGHCLAEFYSRIACSLACAAQGTLVFASTGPVAGFAATAKWFQSLMDWYGVPRERILLVSRPTQFATLSVYPQQEQLNNVGPSQAYLDLLDEFALANFGRGYLKPLPGFLPGRPTYVSRAGMATGFAGESYLETLLVQAQVNVFRPEAHGIRRQLDTYCRSGQLLFGEGSALHGLQLLGHALGRVTVLVRRPGERAFHSFVRPRCEAVEYVEVVRDVVHGVTPGGRPRTQDGLPFIHRERLLDGLARAGIHIAPLWDDARFREAERASVERWLAFNADQPHCPESVDGICTGLARHGYGDLVPGARTQLATPPAHAG